MRTYGVCALLLLLVMLPLFPTVTFSASPLEKSYRIVVREENQKVECAWLTDHLSLPILVLEKRVRGGLFSFRREENDVALMRFQRGNAGVFLASPFLDPVSPFLFGLSYKEQRFTLSLSGWSWGKEPSSPALIRRKRAESERDGCALTLSATSTWGNVSWWFLKGKKTSVEGIFSATLRLPVVNLTLILGKADTPYTFKADFQKQQKGGTIKGNGELSYGERPLFCGEYQTMKINWMVNAERTAKDYAYGVEHHVRMTRSTAGKRKRRLAWTIWGKVDKYRLSVTVDDAATWKCTFSLSGFSVSYGSAGWKIITEIHKEYPWGNVGCRLTATEGKRASLTWSCTL